MDVLILLKVVVYKLNHCLIWATAIELYGLIIPDVCHLLKNLKSATLKGDIILPVNYCESNKLQTQIVKGFKIAKLWTDKINTGKKLRFTPLES